MSRHSPPSLLSQAYSTFLTKLTYEKQICQHHTLTIIMVCISFYIHGVITLFIESLHLPRSPLWDFGFDVFKHSSYNFIYALAVLARIALYGLTILSILQLYVKNKNIYLSVLFIKYSVILTFCQFLRILTLFSTMLPSPIEECHRVMQDPSASSSVFSWATYVPHFFPWNHHMPISLFPRTTCGGDHVFSYHSIVFVLCLMFTLKYSKPRLQFVVGVLSAINLYLLVFLRLNYSLDVFVGFFTTVLMFLLLDAKGHELIGDYLPSSRLLSRNVKPSDI